MACRQETSLKPGQRSVVAFMKRCAIPIPARIVLRSANTPNFTKVLDKNRRVAVVLHVNAEQLCYIFDRDHWRHGENVDTKTDHDRDWGGLRLRAGGTAAESRGREGEDDACEWEF